MGLMGKVRAYKSGWGEILGPLPEWMKASGVVELGSETVLSANIALSTRVDLIQSHREGNWKMAVESWAEGGKLQQGSAEVIGRRSTPPILLRSTFVKACLRGLEDFDRYYEGSADTAQVFQRIHELRTSGLM
jgi:hypothetical protein